MSSGTGRRRGERDGGGRGGKGLGGERDGGKGGWREGGRREVYTCTGKVRYMYGSFKGRGWKSK